MRIYCPQCQAAIEIGANSGQGLAMCPSCGYEFTVDGQATVDFRPFNESESHQRLHVDSDRYELLAVVGKGGLSEVWKALDRRLNRHVAIKVSRFGYRRLLDEATAAAQLQHPGLARILDAGQAGGQTYLVTEYVEGHPLTEWLTSSKRISQRDAAFLCEQLAWAVQHAHDHGVIHRDLKPANILIRPSGAPCIVDFGVATTMAKAREPNAVAGTPAYMAPEQAGGDAIDHRVDIYAIGAILYELLAGRRPIEFAKKNLHELLKDLQEVEPPPLKHVDRRISTKLDAICMKCLAKDPSNRFATARDLAGALRQAYEEIEGKLASGRGVGRWQFWFDRQFGVAALGLLTVFAVLAAGLLLRQSSIAAIMALPVVGTLLLLLIRAVIRGIGTTLKESPAYGESTAWEAPALTQLERKVAELDRMLVTSQQEHQLYRSLVESLPLCVFRTDLDGKLVFTNDFFSKAFGVPPHARVGATLRDIFPVAIADKQQADDRHVLATDGIVGRLEEHPAVSGESTAYEVMKLPVRNFRGDVIGVQTMMFDVSAHAKAERALRTAKQAAETANAAKNMFLANMSHEIRTPMNAVIGMTDLLLSKTPPGQSQHFLSLILSSAKGLLAIIDEILDFSKIESGHMELRAEPLDLRDLLDQLQATFAVPTACKDITLSVTMGSGVPGYVTGDCLRLRQVLINLLGNAIKFTEHGQVALAVNLANFNGQPDDLTPTQTMADDRVALRFSVRDMGVGIPDEKQQAIFAPFVQADGSISRRYGGTGLGLAISSQLVRLMGGAIKVKSQVGEGSEFYFTLEFPVADPALIKPTMADSRSAAAKPTGPLRILVAEDHPINREFAAHALKAEGHTVVLVNNGLEAVEAIKKSEFDLVLMDVQMPVMDGLQATDAIRQLEAARDSRVPIIAMTAHAMSGDRDKCLAAGMDGYIGKPILVTDLYQAICGILAEVKSRFAGHDELAVAPASDESFDRTNFLARTGNDVAFARRIVAMFEEDYPQLRSNIQNALSSKDAKALADAAHTLKGVVKNFHAAIAIATIEALERSARQQDYLAAAADWEQLQREMVRLQMALRAFVASAP